MGSDATRELVSIDIPPGIDMRVSYYLAGPMTGLPEYNYPRFKEVALSLRNQGLIVCSPAEIPFPEGLQAEELWKFMMRKALTKLLGSDAVILLEGWRSSKGAAVEVDLASSINMRFFEVQDNRVVSLSDL